MNDSPHMRPLVRVCPRLALVTVASAGLLSAGCSRSLTITQSEYVNAAEHVELGRNVENQTGVPLKLDVAPIMFHPPGACSDALYIKIGVDSSRPHFGQYAEIDADKCKRKMHGSDGK